MLTEAQYLKAQAAMFQYRMDHNLDANDQNDEGRAATRRHQPEDLYGRAHGNRWRACGRKRMASRYPTGRARELQVPRPPRLRPGFARDDTPVEEYGWKPTHSCEGRGGLL